MPKNKNMAKCNSLEAKQLTHYPELEGSKAAITGTGRDVEVKKPGQCGSSGSKQLTNCFKFEFSWLLTWNIIKHTIFMGFNL